MTLPPDPYGTNAEHASDTEKVIARFTVESCGERQDSLADLLTNLMHWADYYGFDFSAELERAKANYEDAIRE